MPKKLFKVANFHGGIDETSSAVDLKEGFFPDLTDVMVDRLGQVVPMGDFANAPTQNPTSTAFITHADPGYGLFAYPSSRRLSGALADCVIYVVQQFVASDVGENLIFWDSVGNSWSVLSAIDLGSSAANTVHPDFFVLDNVLRICDGNFANISVATTGVLSSTTSRGWVGYVENYRFKGTSPGGSADSVTAWKTLTSPAPAAPTRGACSGYMNNGPTGAVATTVDTTSVQLTDIGQGDLYAVELDDGDGSVDGHRIICDMANVATTAPEITVVIDGQITADIDNGGSLSGSDKNWRIYPPAGTGVNIDIRPGSTGGYLPDVGGSVDSGDGVTTGETHYGDAGLTPYAGYKIASTFVYDGFQESPIYEMPLGHSQGMTAGYAGICINGDETSTGSFSGSIMVSKGYNDRITGCRIYCTHTDDPMRNWFLMWDVDFNQGARTSMSTEVFISNLASAPFTLDVLHGDTDDIYLWMTLPKFVGPIGDTTYFTINGHSGEENIDIRYKTSAIVGGFVYVGNVYKTVDGRGQSFPDRIWRCAFSTFAGKPQPDVFPEKFYSLNPATSGDPIVKLESLGNQLLSFSSSFLTVWTQTAEGLGVSGTFSGYGVDKPCQVTRTPNGIAFANKSGAFLWNGSDVVRLLEKRGKA